MLCHITSNFTKIRRPNVFLRKIYTRNLLYIFFGIDELLNLGVNSNTICSVCSIDTSVYCLVLVTFKSLNSGHLIVVTGSKMHLLRASGIRLCGSHSKCLSEAAVNREHGKFAYDIEAHRLC